MRGVIDMGRCWWLQLHAASQVMDKNPFHDYLFVVFILFLSWSSHRNCQGPLFWGSGCMLLCEGGRGRSCWTIGICKIQPNQMRSGLDLLPHHGTMFDAAGKPWDAHHLASGVDVIICHNGGSHLCCEQREEPWSSLLSSGVAFLHDFLQVWFLYQLEILVLLSLRLVKTVNHSLPSSLTTWTKMFRVSVMVCLREFCKVLWPLQRFSCGNSSEFVVWVRLVMVDASQPVTVGRESSLLVNLWHMSGCQHKNEVFISTILSSYLAWLFHKAAGMYTYNKLTSWPNSQQGHMLGNV